MTNFSIKEKIKKYFSNRKNKFSITGISIEFDWMLVVCISIVFVIFVFSSELRTFNQIMSGEIYKIETTLKDFDDTKIISRIDSIIDRFENKKIEFDKFAPIRYEVELEKEIKVEAE